MSETVLRVLVLGDGNSFHLERYVAELGRQRCEAMLASLEDGPINYFRLRRGKPKSRISYFLAVPEIRRIIQHEFKPDIVNAHFATGYGASAAIACLGLSVPIMLQLWGSDILIIPKRSFLHKLKAVIALKSADLVVGDSQYLLDEARQFFSFPHGEVVPIGIERQFCAKKPESRHLQTPVRVISLRSHEPVYDHRTALEGLRPFLEEERIHWTLPEWGSEMPAFREAAGRLIGRSIHPYTRKSRQDIMTLLQEQDVYLSASLSDSSPVSLIEGMGTGLVPVCADIPGIREWLKPDNGFLFPCTDSLRLRQIFEQLLSSADDYLPLRIRNWEKVRRDGILENNVARVVSLMHDVIAFTKDNE